MDALRQFHEVWAIDTEYRRLPGGLPEPVCCVAATEMRSGREVRRWTEHGAPQPFDTGPDNLFIAHYSSAECLSFLMLGWELPTYIVDTYVEGRRITNGLPGRKTTAKSGESQQRKCGLIHLAARYGIRTISDAEKNTNRELAMRGGPWASDVQQNMMNYCLGDARACRDVFNPYCPDGFKPP